MSADVLPPGGEGQIKVTLTAKGGHETIEKHVVVLSDDPERPRFSLTMKGKLQVDVRAEPSQVRFAELGPGEAATTTVVVTLVDPAAVTLESVALDDDGPFTLTPIADQPGEPATPGQRRYALGFAGSRELGNFATRLVIRTSGEHTPTLTVPVRANVVGNLRYPKQLRFVERDGVIGGRQLRIQTRDGQPVEIGRIDDRGGLLTLTPRPAEAGGQVFDAEIDAQGWAALDPDQRGRPRIVVLHTDDRDQPTVEIAYVVAPARAQPARATQVAEPAAPPATR